MQWNWQLGWFLKIEKREKKDVCVVLDCLSVAFYYSNPLVKITLFLSLYLFLLRFFSQCIFLTLWFSLCLNKERQLSTTLLPNGCHITPLSLGLIHYCVCACIWSVCNRGNQKVLVIPDRLWVGICRIRREDEAKLLWHWEHTLTQLNWKSQSQ